MSEPKSQPTSTHLEDRKSGLSSDERNRLEAMTVRDPDDLLAPPRKAALTFAIFFSIFCHVVVFGVTSLSLIDDWRQYGVKLPADLRAEKKQQLESEKQKERDAKIEAERESAASATDTEKPDTGSDNSTSTAVDPSASPENEKRDKPTKSFNLDDIDLDL